MSTATDALIERMRKARESWCELAPGKRVCIRRPGELAMANMRGGVAIETLCSFAVAWDGITEADLLPGGSENYAPFDAALWAELVADRAEWASLVAAHVMERIAEHVAQREAARGNSEPS